MVQKMETLVLKWKFKTLLPGWTVAVGYGVDGGQVEVERARGAAALCVGQVVGLQVYVVPATQPQAVDLHFLLWNSGTRFQSPIWDVCVESSTTRSSAASNVGFPEHAPS